MPSVNVPGVGLVNFPEGMSQQDIIAAIERDILPQAQNAPKPQTGFVAGIKGGFESLKGDVAALGIPLGVEGAEAAREEYKKKAAQIYRQPELTEAPWEYIKGLAGQSLAYMGAPLAAGTAAAVAAPGAAVAGIGAGALAAFGTSAAQFTGSNISRQIEEKIKPEDVDAMAAIGAAIPQAALDTIGLKYIPGIQRIFRQAGAELTREEAAHIVRNGIVGTAVNTAKAYGPSTIKAMGTEGLTEAAQQVFERAQAGLELTDPEARKEYFDNFVGGAILGGGISIPGRAIERSIARGKYAAEDREAARREAAAAGETTAGETTEGMGFKPTPVLPDTYAEAVQEVERLKRETQTAEIKARIDELEAYKQRLLTEDIEGMRRQPYAEPATLEDQIRNQTAMQGEFREMVGLPTREVTPEAEAAPAAEKEMPTVLDADTLSATGLPKQSGFFKQLLGKDLTNFQDLDAVTQILERVRKNKTLSPDTKAALETIATNAFNIYGQQAEMFGPRGGVLEPVKEIKPTAAEVKIAEVTKDKDLTDPAQVEEVRAEITDFANAPTRSQADISAAAAFLDSLPSAAPEATDVIQPTEPIESAVEPSPTVAEQRGALPPGGITAPLPGGMDATRGAAQQPDVGAGVQPTALEGAPTDVTPAAPPAGGALALPAPTAGGAAAPAAPAASPLLPPTTPGASTALATVQAAPTAAAPAVEAEAVPEGAGVPALAEGKISLGDAISRMVFSGYNRKEAVDYLRNVVDPFDNSVALEDLSNVIEGQFRVIDEETLAPAVLQLASPEQQALADHYGAPVNSPQFLAKLREDIHNFAVKGAQAVDKAIRNIIKKLQSAVLAVAVIMNPNYMSNPLPVAVPKTTVTYEQVQATVPAEVRESLSPAAQQAYATIFPAIQADLKAKNKLFVLTDKPNARVVIFTADGKPVLDKKVLLGKTMGDFYKGNTDVVSNRVTPAGLFNLGLRDAAKGGGEAKTAGGYDFGKVFVLDKAIDGEYSVTLFHSVWTKEKDAQQRLAALKKEGAEDSRYSFGCINVDKESYKFLLDNYGQQMNGAKMFVVPDTPGAVMDFINGKAVAAGDIKREAVQPKVEKVTKTEPSAPAPAETRAEEVIRPEDRLAGKGAKPLYRTIEDTGEGMPKSKVEAIVRDAISRWKNAPNTQVVQDIQELPQELYQQMVRDNAFDAPGIFDPTTQTVFLIADNIPNAKEAVLTLTHEALGHFGIQSILGNTYGKVMDDIYNGNAKVRELAQKKMETGLDKRTAVEEVLADMAEKGVYNNAIQRIFNAIRQFFRKIGLTKAVTDAEVREVLANAQRFVVAGGPRTEGAAAFKGKPLYRAGTDAFKKWFGNSVVRNPDGSPKLMYHGTARDISEFQPKQANAIFLTDDPRFAEGFAYGSEDWMIRHKAEFFTPEQMQVFRGQARANANKNATDYSDELYNLLRENLPTGKNIIPVYVSAQNPFDYQNPEHVEKLSQQHGGFSDFILESISSGSWSTIEDKNIQKSIRDAGFDGFYVSEGGRKNLAVYDSSQLKSPFNSGAYSREDRRILYRRRKEEPLTAEGQRAAALNERMKNIANEPEPDVDQTFMDRLTLMSEKSKGIPMAIRQAVVDKDAPVKEKLAAAYQNKVTNSLGEIRGDVLNEQAQEATGVADQLMRRGGIRVGADGLYEVYDRVENGQSISLDGVFEIIIEKLGAKLGSAKEAVTLAHRAFIAQRANEINKNNALFESQAEAAEAKGNKQAAAQLRKKIIRVRASQAEINAGLEAMNTFPELKQAFDTFTKYNEGIIDFLVSTGRLSPAQAKDWKENVGYVPWTRVEEDTNKLESANKLRTGNVHLTELPKLDTEGSSKEIRNVLDNMVGNTIWAIRSGLKNRAAVKTLEQLPDAEELKTQDEVDRELKNNKQLVVFAYRDGERVAFRVQNQEDVAAFSSVVDVAGPVMKAFTIAATGLRSFVTHMPTFALSQLMQDTGRAMFLSGVKHPFSLPSKVLSNFYHVVTGGETDIQALGITGAYDGMPDHAMRRARERHGLQERNAFLRAWDKLEDFSLAADMAVRAAIYEQTMQETGDRVLAFHRAKEYINFKTGGNGQTVRVLRQIIPFMNAYIQGMDVLYRTMQGKGLSMEDRKAAMALFYTTGAKVAALSLLYAALVGDDDDYKGLDDYERDKNFIIPGTGLKIPVAPEIGFLFKVLPERIYQAIAREGTDRPVDATTFMRGMRDAAINAYGGVNLTPQLIKPAIEVATNYSFFTNNPIVGINMAGKETYLQFTSSTSEIAKLFGHIGISPLKVDYLLRGYLGTVGGVMLDVTDAVADPDRMSKPVNKLPLIKTFMYDDTGRGYKTEFYQFREDVDKVVNSVNTFKREGRAEELQEYLTEDKLKLYAMKGVVNKIEDHLGNMRRYRNIIANDPDLTPEEKREKTDEILKKERELLLAYNIPKLKQMAGY